MRYRVHNSTNIHFLHAMLCIFFFKCVSVLSARYQPIQYTKLSSLLSSLLAFDVFHFSNCCGAGYLNLFYNLFLRNLYRQELTKKYIKLQFFKFRLFFFSPVQTYRCKILLFIYCEKTQMQKKPVLIIMT